MSRTIAVRSAAVAAALLWVVSCGVGSHSPTEPSCRQVSGTWDASFVNSCGGSGSGVVVVAQVGCNFEALIPGFGGGNVAGQIEGDRASFTLYFSYPCSGSATGTATITGSTLHGTYSGGATGFGCCNPVTGSFTLTR
ncbi:MAG: hypothetical protein IPL90_12060 [Holophagales bacterium]|nr:hypothetical protein [Holophagales bacterium]